MGKSQSKHKKQEQKQKQQKIYLKIVLIGEAKVGKTSILRQYAHVGFNPQYKRTIGADFLTKYPTIKEQSAYLCSEEPKVVMQIWDTAGNQKYKSLQPIYLRDSDGAIIVYDTNDINTIQKVKEYHFNQIKESCPNSKIMLLGNEIQQKCKKTIEEAESFAKQKEIIHEVVNAKTGDNLTKTMNKFVWQTIKARLKLYAWKDVYMTFLLQIHEDFDDDLLQDILQLLVDF